MAVTAQISSSLPFSFGEYEFRQQAAIPVTINIFNSDTTAHRINTLYLTTDGEATPLGLGEAAIKRTSIFYGGGGGNQYLPAGAQTSFTSSYTSSVTGATGDNDPSVWSLLPNQSFNVYQPIPNLDQIENWGYYSRIYYPPPDPPFMSPVNTGSNQAIVNCPPLPIFSGAVQYSSALEIHPAQWDINLGYVMNGQMIGIQVPDTSSQCNVFTYEWWSRLNGYGIPTSPYSTFVPTNNAGTVWKTFGFPFIEGAGAQIGYLSSGELYIMMEQDYTAVLPPNYPHAPPYVGISSSATVPLNQWVHQAITRNSAGLVTFWINGTASGTGTRLTSSNPHYFYDYYIGCDNLALPYYVPSGNPPDPLDNFTENTCDGYFAEMRFSNVCRYTSNFTPSNQAFSASYSGSGNSVVSGAISGTYFAASTSSFPTFFYPQLDPTNQYPDPLNYRFNVGGVVMIDSSPAIINATASQFKMALDPSGIQTTCPNVVWSLTDNTRPPSNYDFDVVCNTSVFVSTNDNIVDGNGIILPLDFCNYSSSDTGIATVVQNGAFSSTTASANGYTQLIGGAGAVTFTGQTGSVEITNILGGELTGSVIITVVDALPVALNVYPQLQNVTVGSSYQYTAYLKKTNGSVVQLGLGEVDWSTSNENAGTIDGTGLLSVFGGAGQQLVINATAQGLNATSVAIIQN